ncbi:MAG: type VI secretion system baseplate subunit TssK [Shimia sp.]
MARGYRVVWREGLMLQAQHLQQADAHLDKRVADLARAVDPYMWGVSAVRFSDHAGPRIGVDEVAAVFQDGLAVRADASSPEALPAAIPVPKDAVGKHVWLTIAEQSFASRFDVIRHDVEDVLAPGGDRHPIEVAGPRLELRLADGPPPGTHALHLARIAEVTDTSVLRDPRSTPTALRLAADARLGDTLRQVLEALDARLEQLSATGLRPAAGAALQDVDFLLRVTLSRARAHIAHLEATRDLHPREAYLALAALAGEVACFEEGGDGRAYVAPPYDHVAPLEAMRILAERIRVVLRQITSHWRKVALLCESEESEQGVEHLLGMAAFAQDPGELDRAEFFVELRGDYPPATFREQCKIAPLDIIDDIVNDAALPGLTIEALPHAPQGLGQTHGSSYFKIAKDRHYWNRFQDGTPTLSFDIPNPKRETIDLTLWAYEPPRGRS